MAVQRAFKSFNTRVSRQKTSVLSFVLALVVSTAGFIAHPNSVAAKPAISITKDDGWKSGPLPQGVNKKDIDALVETAMGSPDNQTRVRSVLIVVGGKIVYERYHPLENK